RRQQRIFIVYLHSKLCRDRRQSHSHRTFVGQGNRVDFLPVAHVVEIYAVPCLPGQTVTVTRRDTGPEPDTRRILYLPRKRIAAHIPHGKPLALVVIPARTDKLRSACPYTNQFIYSDTCHSKAVEFGACRYGKLYDIPGSRLYSKDRV